MTKLSEKRRVLLLLQHDLVVQDVLREVEHFVRVGPRPNFARRADNFREIFVFFSKFD